MRSTLVSSITDSPQGTEFLAAAVTLASAAVNPAALPQDFDHENDSSTAMEDSITSELVESELIKTLGTNEKIGASEGQEAGDGTTTDGETTESSTESSGEPDNGETFAQLASSCIGSGAQLEALFRVLEDMSKTYSQLQTNGASEQDDNAEENLLEFDDKPVHGEWMSKAVDVDVDALLRQCNNKVSEDTQDEAATDGAETKEEESQIDSSVRQGFSDLISTFYENLKEQMSKLRESKKISVKKSVEHLSPEEQVDRLADRIATSHAMLQGSRKMQQIGDQYRLLSALKGFRRFDEKLVTGADSDDAEMQIEEVDEASPSETESQ